MFEDFMIKLLEVVCDDFCNCQACQEDDAPCYLEEKFKEFIRAEMKEYLDN